MIAAGLTLIAFVLLAASTSRHAPALLGGWDAPRRRPALGVAGWLALLLGMGAAILRADWPLALVAWLGLLPLAAGVVLLALTYQPRAAHLSAAIGAALILAGVLA
ncbi:DUF3325 domain-containing protein [Sphingomonas sp. RS6]